MNVHQRITLIEDRIRSERAENARNKTLRRKRIQQARELFKHGVVEREGVLRSPSNLNEYFEAHFSLSISEILPTIELTKTIIN